MKTNSILIAIVLFVLTPVDVGAQVFDPALTSSGGACATPQLNDPVVLREAWANTKAYYPGIEEAMNQWSLKKLAAPPQVGDQQLFWLYNIQNRRFDTLRAELKAVGNISYVWVALGEWQNNHVTVTEVNAILKALEISSPPASRDSTKGILALDRQFFGDPPNIDSNFDKGKGDGKTHFLICDILDGWSGSGYYVAGFFFSVDVDPNSGAQSNSNRRDMLYIDSYPGIYRNGNRNITQALSTLAHEFQHLVHWNYDRTELTFFNEGLSEYAEYVSGYSLRSSSDYFVRTSVTLTSWNNTIADYSRAALWTLYLSEQFGDTFIRNFVQNPASGVTGFEATPTQSGSTESFTPTAVNWFTANWVGFSPAYPEYSYRHTLASRPTLLDEHLDPNASRSSALPPLAVDYLAFTSGSNLGITFSLPSGIVVRAVESGPNGLRVRDVAGGLEFSSPEFGTSYPSIVFVVSNASTFSTSSYSYTSTGTVTRFLVEEKYDDGTPRRFAPGFEPYLGFGNNSTAKGFAVRFHPAVNHNVLTKARLMVMFNQEFSNGTALPTDDKDFTFHVWGDDNGRPGRNLITPFLVTVDRKRYPIGSFVDVDLSNYASQLTNLSNPIYVGLTEDDDDSVGTYVAVHNLVSTDYSYVFRSPNDLASPNTWTTMREVSARNENKLDGFNLMFRAVFEYSDSSEAPRIVPGFLQHPVFSEYIKVIAASSDELRLASLSGSFSQTSGTTPLSFVTIPGTYRAFIDTTQLLKGSGTVTIRVRGAKRYGVFFSDTLIAFTAKLAKRGEPLFLASESGELMLAAPAGAVTNPVLITAFEGVADPQFKFPPSKQPTKVYSLGPAGMDLSAPATIRINSPPDERELTLAIYRDERWLSLPTIIDQSTSQYVGTLPMLGIVGLVDKDRVEGTIEPVPSSFALYQNFPNPFNPSTKIQYDLPQARYVRLVVYDLLGKAVRILVDGDQLAGRHSVTFDGRGLTSGVYFYRLSAGEFTQVKKLVLIR